MASACLVVKESSRILLARGLGKSKERVIRKDVLDLQRDRIRRILLSRGANPVEMLVPEELHGALESEGTRTHLKAIYRKLNVSSQNELIEWVRGLEGPGGGG
jgi:Fe2+ or Zn2+ uptake regulation protein